MSSFNFVYTYEDDYKDDDDDDDQKKEWTLIYKNNFKKKLQAPLVYFLY